MRERFFLEKREDEKGKRENSGELSSVREMLIGVQRSVQELPDTDSNKAEILENLRLATEELTVYLSL